MAYDFLPFPNIFATEAKEQADQVNNYLIQLKETLEFALTNIGEENLSAELNQKLKELGADIVTTSKENMDQIQQVATRSGISVSDVINSASFKKALKDVEDQIPTKYLVSVEEDESGLIYTFTNESGESVTITIPENAGESGGETYSTEETVIGTWIDGKPIYRTVISVVSPSAVDAYEEVYDFSTLNIETIVDLNGMIGFGMPINFYYSDDNNFITWLTESKICMKAGHANYLSKASYLTLEYTKTTD